MALQVVHKNSEINIAQKFVRVCQSTVLTLLCHAPIPTALPWLVAILSFSLTPVSFVYTIFVAT